MEFIGAAVRQRKTSFLRSDAGQLTGIIREFVRDDMRDVAFALDPAFYPDHPAVATKTQVASCNRVRLSGFRATVAASSVRRIG